MRFLRGLRWGVVDLYWVRIMLPTPGWRRDHEEFGEPLRIYYGGPGPGERWCDIVPCPSLFKSKGTWHWGVTSPPTRTTGNTFENCRFVWPPEGSNDAS